MSIGLFQKFSSEYYNLYESNAHIELNRMDKPYISRIEQRVGESLLEDIRESAYYYLEGSFGSEGIDELNIDIPECLNFAVIDKYESKDSLELVYELTFFVTAECVSHEYYGRDEDTREVILSPPKYHKFEGEMCVTLSRYLDSDTKLDSDEEFEDFEIVDGTLTETSAIMDFNDELEYPL